MNLDHLSDREKIVMWSILRENFFEMFKEDEEDNIISGHFAQAIAAKIVYGEEGLPKNGD